MKDEDKLQIGKFLFMLINSFFVILGLSLFGASVWILFDTTGVITIVSNEADVKVVAGGLFVIGLVVVGVSMLGCFGVYLENRCIISLYMGFLIAIIFGELFITFLLLIKQNQIERFLTETVDAIISMYGVNNTQTTWSLLDRVQKSAKCCGRQNASDWETNKFIQVQNTSDIYPCSCFNGSCPVFLSNEMYQFGNGSFIYTMGCEQKLKDWFDTNVLVIIGMDLALLIIQVLQFILGFLICQNIGSKNKAQHAENLLDAMENPASSSDPHQNDLEYYHPNINTYDPQVYDAYNQEQTGQTFYQDCDLQHQYQPNIHTYDQKRNDGYDNAAQNYDQYESQVYQHHHGPEHNHHFYNPKPEDDYIQHADPSYEQYYEQHYQYNRDLNQEL